jgi:hypothetical protein
MMRSSACGRDGSPVIAGATWIDCKWCNDTGWAKTQPGGFRASLSGWFQCTECGAARKNGIPLTGMNEREAYESLCAEILEHNRRYYVAAKPSISDHAYDALFAQVRAIEARHPDWVTPASPTQRRVGHTADGV